MKHLTTWLGENVWMLAAVIGGQGFKRNHTNLAGTEEVASDGRSGRSEEKWLNGASRPPSNAQRENRVAVNFAVIHCKLRCHATTTLLLDDTHSYSGCRKRPEVPGGRRKAMKSRR